MRDIHKLCKICLSETLQGSRNIFENGFGNLVQSRDDLNRIVEKLRFVTLLKINPKENLPSRICDLCIVQLNVSYNFKRLALKNDFYIRQYMIENGMSLTKDDDEHEMETSLEIHQIHNVIRTSNRFRPALAPASEQRRNSTTSSISGLSTMMLNGCESNLNGNGTETQFALPPSRPFVQPIQIKTEPIDPDYEDNSNKQTGASTCSPTSSGSAVTVHSSARENSPPMIRINGNVADIEKAPVSTTSKPAPLSKKISNPVSKPREKKAVADKEPLNRNLRTIQKKPDENVTKRKLREAAIKTLQKQKEKAINDAKVKRLRRVVKRNDKKTKKYPVKNERGKKVAYRPKNSGAKNSRSTAKGKSHNKKS